jgi:hypothetical protein
MTIMLLAVTTTIIYVIVRGMGPATVDERVSLVPGRETDCHHIDRSPIYM